jgi:hypothetical protein
MESYELRVASYESVKCIVLCAMFTYHRQVIDYK